MLLSLLLASQWTALDSTIHRAIADRVFPGAVVVVGRRDTLLFARGYGRVSWERDARRPDPDSTLWDLASLTKVVATAAVAAVYVDRGPLDLDLPVRRYLPAFRGGERDWVTVRMLLDHTSGLRAWAPLWREATTREGAVARLLAETPRQAPGHAVLYSDLNALLLGLVLERVGGARLDSLAAREVFRPLGLRDMRFGVGPRDRARTAPSRLEGGRPLTGYVNDDNARRLNGVAGHAGLFGTAVELARFAQIWLGAPTPSGTPWISSETTARFLTRTPLDGGRPLGWDVPDTTAVSMFGALAHPFSFGHTGWTGTSLWIDPRNDLFVVFLSNRSISPRGTRSLREIRLVRSEVADAARRATGTVCLAIVSVAC